MSFSVNSPGGAISLIRRGNGIGRSECTRNTNYRTSRCSRDIYVGGRFLTGASCCLVPVALYPRCEDPPNGPWSRYWLSSRPAACRTCVPLIGRPSPNMRTHDGRNTPEVLSTSDEDQVSPAAVR